MKKNSKIIKVSNKQKILNYISSLKSEYIEISELNGERSELIKRWYFAGLREYLKELGYINEDLMTKSEITLIVNKFHDKLKDMFIDYKIVEIDGEIEKVKPTTSDLDNQQFIAYCEKVFSFLKDFAPINYDNLQ